MKLEPIYKHLYGPVPSRRLGRSLGIDMVPHKTCCFDCIYCQLGRTTNHTMKVAEYTPAHEIILDLERWMRLDGQADYLTFSGSGEPTLQARLADIMALAHEQSDVPIALLTNGALLWTEQGHAAALQADVLMPSLDAATPETFEIINRPCKGLTLDRVIEGLVESVADCPGETWLEVMVVQGINDSDEELGAIAEAAARINPDQIQINTVVRPVPGGGVERVSDAQLEHACEVLGPKASVIPSAWERGSPEGAQRSEDEVLALVEYRPCTLQDIAHGLGIHPNEAIKYVDHLLADGKISQTAEGDETYFTRADFGE
ncbi:MAG: radical SAM protein [Armatimonadetes bacterium]|nr:radical SAM protein [Armatimonadota bacterium]